MDYIDNTRTSQNKAKRTHATFDTQVLQNMTQHLQSEEWSIDPIRVIKPTYNVRFIFPEFLGLNPWEGLGYRSCSSPVNSDIIGASGRCRK